MRKHQYIVALLLCLLAAHPTWAGDSEIDRATLKGLGSIAVACDINPITEKLGVTCEQLQTDVELQLRKAGIRIDDKKSYYLYINVNVVDSGVNTYAIAMEMSFQQPVRLDRASTIIVLAPTWGIYPVVLTSPRPGYTEFCRQYVRDLADRFANAFLSVNPK
jgi:hypothetical protein